MMDPDSVSDAVRTDEYEAPIRIQSAAANWDEFDKLPEAVQRSAWSQLRVEADRKLDGIVRFESGKIEFEDARPKVKRPAWVPPRRADEDGAALNDIPAPEYIYALSGLEIQPGRKGCCPFPDHEDGSASFAAYDDHWYCFGCSRGGRIWDFAAILWGYPQSVRGDSFREVRARLLETL